MLCSLGAIAAPRVCRTNDGATWTNPVVVNSNTLWSAGLPLSSSTAWTCFSTTTYATTGTPGPPANGDFIIVGPDPGGPSTNHHQIVIDTAITLGDRSAPGPGVAATAPYYRGANNIVWSASTTAGSTTLVHVDNSVALPAGVGNNTWVTFVSVTGANSALYELQGYQITNFNVAACTVGNSCFDLAGSNNANLPTNLSGRLIVLPAYLRVGSTAGGYGAVRIAPGVTVTFAGQGPIGDDALSGTNNTTYSVDREPLQVGNSQYGGANLYFDSPNGDATVGGNMVALARNNRYSFLGTTFQVTGAANNGSGAIRLTLAASPPHNILTGQLVTVTGLDGVPDASPIDSSGNARQWTATVIDGTHIDLQGSTWRAADNLRTSNTGYNGTVGVHSQIWGRPPTGAGASNTSYVFFSNTQGYDNNSIVVQGADFFYMGKSAGSGDWWQVGISGAANDPNATVSISDALFDHCGVFNFATVVSANNLAVHFTRSYWTNTQSSSAITGLFTNITGATLDRVSFSKALAISNSSAAISNYYGWNMTNSGPGVFGSCTTCFVRIDKSTGPTANAFLPMQNIANSYIVADNSGNPAAISGDTVFLQPGATSTLNINGLVTELWGTTGVNGNAWQTNGSLLTMSGNVPNGAFTWTFKHILILPNPYGNASLGNKYAAPWPIVTGTIAPAGGGSIQFEHDTVAVGDQTNGLFSMGSGGSCGASAVSSLKSNIGFDYGGMRTFPPGTVVNLYTPLFQNGLTNNTVNNDCVPGTTADYNGGWNLTAWDKTGADTCHTASPCNGTAACSLFCSWLVTGKSASSPNTLNQPLPTLYPSPMSVGATPGAHDLGANVNPLFVTANDGLMPDGVTSLRFQRRIATWAVMNGWSNETGMTQQAFLDAVTVLRQDPTLTADLYNWVRAGYAPTNPAYQAAHDNVAPSNGWIGAVQGATPSCTDAPIDADTSRPCKWVSEMRRGGAGGSRGPSGGLGRSP